MIKELIAKFALWLIGETAPEPEPQMKPQSEKLRQRRGAKRVDQSVAAVAFGKGRPLMDAAIVAHRERRKEYNKEHPELQEATVVDGKVVLKPGELFPGVRPQ